MLTGWNLRNSTTGRKSFSVPAITRANAFGGVTGPGPARVGMRNCKPTEKERENIRVAATCGTFYPISLGTENMYFTLPDLPGICRDPFSPSFNPHYEAVASESKAWIDSLGILSGEKQRYFSTSAFEFLAAHTYPYADREGYRTCCDYLNTTFILDDYSDDEGGKGARRMADSFMNALRDPTWDDGTPFARMARESVCSSSHKATIILTRWNALSRFRERLARRAPQLDNASSTRSTTTSTLPSAKRKTENKARSSV
jgi:hypothetical protein